MVNRPCKTHPIMNFSKYLQKMRLIDVSIRLKTPQEYVFSYVVHNTRTIISMSMDHLVFGTPL